MYRTFVQLGGGGVIEEPAVMKVSSGACSLAPDTILRFNCPTDALIEPDNPQLFARGEHRGRVLIGPQGINGDFRMEIHFRKLHENGNDFIIIDEWERTAIPDDMKAQFAELYCDRHFGIGAEGVLYLSRSDKANLKIRVFRPDAGEAEMCGNGIRCLVKYAFDAGYVKESCTVETPAGETQVVAGYRDDEFSATVTMTAPKFDRKDIPANGEGEYRETIGVHEVFAANTGTPHAVVFVPDLEALDIGAHAPQIRYHETFPEGANVNFVQVTGPDAISIRTYGRGFERETLSCSAGATASAAIAHKLGKVGATVQVETQGGPLTITLGDVTKMEGPATTVFSGVISF